MSNDEQPKFTKRLMQLAVNQASAQARHHTMLDVNLAAAHVVAASLLLFMPASHFSRTLTIVVGTVFVAACVTVLVLCVVLGRTRRALDEAQAAWWRTAKTSVDEAAR